MSVRALVPAILLLLALGLAGCDSKAERAEAYYQRALALVAAGEPERAAIEFRNVFRLNGKHLDARLAYARLLRDGGETRKAMEHYAILVDQDRDSLEGHKELAALALAALDVPTAEAAARRAFELAPDDPEARALKATVDYRAAPDAAGRAAAVALAEGTLADAPGTVAASLVVIADRLRAEDAAAALAAADAALAAAAPDAPPDEALHLLRLAVVERLGDDDAVGAAIDRMATLFPENPGVTQAQVAWRLRRGDAAGAEAVLRARAAAAPAEVEPALTVARFLYETAGPAPARAELDRLIVAGEAGGADPLPFRRARAGLDFDAGDHAGAIAALRALVEGATASDAIRDVQTELAAMLDATGDAAGRDALLATVLAEDPRHVAALKLRARAAIAADQPATAIQDMRAALREAPRDPEAMTIMAEAHEREGSHELAAERLALAVEASDRAPAESARYARFLMAQGRLGPAEGVTTDALRREPENRDLLALLGEIHVARGDWPRVGQVAEILRRQDDPAAAAIAARLETARLAGEGRTEEALAALRDAAAAGDADPEALGRLMQATVAAGDVAGAQAYLDALLARDPASRPGRMMQAGLHATRGETAEAEALYRALIAEAPAEAAAHRALVALLAGTGDLAAADAAIAAGLAATDAALPGGDRELLLMQAGRRETAGDAEGAIAAYETLYARDPGDALIANNLASLLSAGRDDAASLERAYAVARRLRGSDVPQFQDTYGWILHRRGDSAGALRALEPAADALPGNALVQFHAGEALLAAGSAAAARARFAAAVAAAEGGPEAASPQIAAARARLAEIDAAAAKPAAAPTDG